jgi:hypothetical protein
MAAGRWCRHHGSRNRGFIVTNLTYTGRYQGYASRAGNALGVGIGALLGAGRAGRRSCWRGWRSRIGAQRRRGRVDDGSGSRRYPRGSGGRDWLRFGCRTIRSHRGCERGLDDADDRAMQKSAGNLSAGQERYSDDLGSPEYPYGYYLYPYEYIPPTYTLVIAELPSVSERSFFAFGRICGHAASVAQSRKPCAQQPR